MPNFTNSNCATNTASFDTTYNGQFNGDLPCLVTSSQADQRFLGPSSIGAANYVRKDESNGQFSLLKRKGRHRLYVDPVQIE